MIPTLTRRGKMVLCSGGFFIVVGALYGSGPLVAFGGLVVVSLLSTYSWFFPTAILLRRRKIELSWWVPPGDQPGGALSVERPFALHVALRNHGARMLRVLDVRILASTALEPPVHLEAVVPAGRQVEVIGEVRAHSAGYQVLHGAVLVFGDVLGLYDVSAYFPNPLAIKVFPRQANLRSYAAMRPKGGALHERVGLHHVRRRGLAGELREIRDYAFGDPFKFMAWKATARRQKLMVRDLESEIVVTYQFLVDIASTMRGGSPGRTKLDYAIDTAAALARTALEGGDRAGLITFDSRVYSELSPGTGHHHYLKMIDRLVETHSVVDEDLTDLTAGELVAAVARYLAHQEAIDVRLRRTPALDDPAWERVQAGPSGELYDVGVMGQVVSTLLESMGQTSAHKATAPAWWWSRVHISNDSDPQTARLRLFCRLRGIELPYRPDRESGLRAGGLAAALREVSMGSRADVILVISDLHGILDYPEVVLKGLARARRRGQQVIFIAPFGPAFAPRPGSHAAERVADVLRRDERGVVAEATRLLLSHGIRVVEALPTDNPMALMRKLGRGRPRQHAA